MTKPLALLFSAALLLGSGVAQAADKTLCVYDPGGSSGDAYQTAKRYQSAAQGWGVSFTLKPYTDELVAATDFRNGQCDATLLTGVRTQQFNRKSYSVEALGLTTEYSQLKTIVQVLAKERAASLMISGEFETVGIFPAGAVYLYLQDSSVTDVAGLAGKKIATMDFDKAAGHMVKYVGASAVPSDLGTFASQFNNHSVFACYAPATAYQPLELYRGLGDSGGMIKFPLAQLTLQILIRTADFPEGFGQSSRQWSASQFDSALSVVQKAEGSVDSKYWLTLDAARTSSYQQMLRTVRHELIDAGAYDSTVVKLGEQLSGQ